MYIWSRRVNLCIILLILLVKRVTFKLLQVFACLTNPLCENGKAKVWRRLSLKTFCLSGNPLCENGKSKARRRKGLTCSCSGKSNLELDSKAKNKKCNCGHFQLHLPPHFTSRNQRVWFAFSLLHLPRLRFKSTSSPPSASPSLSL